MSNVNIRVNVQGAAGVAQLTSAMGQYAAMLKSVNITQNGMSATFQSNAAGAKAFTGQLQQAIPAMESNKKGLNEMYESMQRIIGGYIQFRIAAGIWNAVTSAVTESVQAVKDYNYEVARSVRTGGINAAGALTDIKYGASYTGDLQKSGETYYQLSTFIKDAEERTKAFNSELKLLVATEGDARSTTRLSIQMYQQFSDQMDKNMSTGEKYSAINEVIATAFKDAHAEVDELAQSFKYLGPIAELTHIKLQDVAAVITVLSGEGHRGRMIGTEMSAFITNLGRNYNEDEGGIVKKGAVYKFTREYTDGFLDINKTIANIIATARTLPVKEQQEYLLAVGGSQNAVRALGVYGPEVLHRLTEETKRMADATHGVSHNLEDMAKTMQSTFKTEGARAWADVLIHISSVVGALIDKLGILKGLTSIASGYDTGLKLDQEASSGMAQMRLLQRDNPQQYYDRMGHLAYTVLSEARRKMRPIITGGISGQPVTTPVEGQPINFEDYTTSYGTNLLGWKYGATRQLSASQSVELESQVRLFMNKKPGEPTLFSDIEAYRKSMLDKEYAVKHWQGPARPYGPSNKLATVTPPIGDVAKTAIGPSKDELERQAREAEREAEAAAREKLDKLTTIKDDLDAQITDIVKSHSKDMLNRLDAIGPSWIRITRQIATLSDDPTTLGRLNRGTDEFSNQRKNASKFLDSQELKDVENVYNRFKNSTAGIWHRDIISAAKNVDALKIDALQSVGDYAAAHEISEFGLSKQILAERAKVLPKDRPFAFHGAMFTTRQLEDIGWQANDRRRRDVGYQLADAGWSSAYGARSGGIGVDPQQENLTRIQRDMSASMLALAKLGTLPIKPGDEERTIRQIIDLTHSIADLGKAADGITSSRKLEDIAKTLDQIQYSAGQQRFSLSLMGRLPGETEEAWSLRQKIARQTELQIYGNQYDKTLSASKELLLNGTPEQKEAARRQLDQLTNTMDSLRHGMDQENVDRRNQRLDQLRSGLKSTFEGDVMQWYRGRKNPMQIATDLGDTLVTNAIQNFIKPFTDPLVNALTSQTQATVDNTNAINSAVNGTGSGAGTTAEGGSGSGKKRGGLPGRGNQYLQYGLAGLSVFQNGMDTGNPFQGGLSGALAGLSMTGGNPIGGLVGGVIGFVGGLFGHHNETPTQTPRLQNPSYFNSPSDFAYDAYRFRLTGQLSQQNLLNLQNAHVPVVNIYIDGVKKEVTAQLSTSTSAGVTGQSNTFFDLHRP